MKYRYFLLLLTVISILQARSQEFIRDFGKCSMDELKLSHCPFDSSAGAMVIYDMGELSYDQYSGYFLVRKKKIKIFSKAGLDAGNFSILFLKGNKISSLKANTYNLVDGKIVKTPLNVKNTYDEQYLDDWYQKKIAMPEVREGSVIEITYKKTDISYLNLPSWYFQEDIPILYSEYNAMVFPAFEYTHRISGELTLADYSSEYVNTIPVTLYNLKYFPRNYRFVMTEVPAFKDPSFITCEDDYLSKVDFQLTGVMQSDHKFESKLSTWEKLNKELLDYENFGSYINASERNGKDHQVTFLSMTPLERAKWVDNYFKTNYKFNGQNRYLSTDVFRKVNDTKTGNSADLNLAAIGFMRAAGIDVKPVILSTRDHGMIQKAYPFLDAFNYIIGLAMIDSAYYMIDVTEPLLRFGDLPARCLNNEGLIVQKEIVDWVNFESIAMSDLKYQINLNCSTDKDSLSCDYTVTSSHYEAYKNRKSYKEDYEALAEKFLGNNYKSYDSIRCNNLNDPDQPFLLTFSKKIELEKVDDHLIINPFCGHAITENPLKEPTRKYPIDFNYKWSRTFSVAIKIPEGYKLASKPENHIVNNKYIRIVYTVTESADGIINLIGLFQFKKDVYPSTDYEIIKAYYDQIVSKFNEQIVLQPIGI